MINVKIIGARETIDEFSSLSNDVNDKAQRHVDDTLNAIASTARQLGTELWVKRPQVSVNTISTNLSAKYVEINSKGAFFQEYGTVHHPPKPAMSPAVDAHIPNFFRKMYLLAEGEEK